MTQTIEFHFDFLSPYTYLASLALPEIAWKAGATIDYRPFDLVALMTAVGNRPTTLECANKGAYAMTDLARWVARDGVAFAPNPHWTEIDFPRLGRIALVAIESGRGAACVNAIFGGMWHQALDLSDGDVLRGLLDEAGFDAEALMHTADGEDCVARYAAATVQAGERGVFGSPTFFCGDAMYFGNDRLDFLAASLEAGIAA